MYRAADLTRSQYLRYFSGLSPAAGRGFGKLVGSLAPASCFGIRFGILFRRLRPLALPVFQSASFVRL
ncbi:MAG: hypothetical protein RBT86_09950, partial [Azospira sp.]|nr:hypothetical protein [Azospira sp.]